MDTVGSGDCKGSDEGDFKNSFHKCTIFKRIFEICALLGIWFSLVDIP
jgi:hypothetical protein